MLQLIANWNLTASPPELVLSQNDREVEMGLPWISGIIVSRVQRRGLLNEERETQS